MFGSQSYLAAVNALLAEHFLGLVELVPENSFAQDLRNAIRQGFVVGMRGSFNEESWLNTFNFADRPVQLCFVAIGFNELNKVPMLEDEYWRSVRNPLVVRGIENKLEKARKYLNSRHRVDVHLRPSKLLIEDWGLADAASSVASQSGGMARPDMMFITELPDPKANEPKHVVSKGNKTFLYYENAKMIGAVSGGIPSPYDYPQCVVVSESGNPHSIVRIEESISGSMLCVVTTTGKRANMGPFDKTSMHAFLEKVAEIVG